MTPEVAAEARPQLAPGLAAETFVAWYWLKAELVAYCRAAGLRSGGDKCALQARILLHLQGTKVHEVRSDSAASAVAGAMPAQFSQTTIIGPGWRCTQALRGFFVAELDNGFRFNGALRDFIHTGAGRTLGDALAEYRQSLAAPRAAIAPQFEYNRHMRAYFEAHPHDTREQARAAWWAKRNRANQPDR